MNPILDFVYFKIKLEIIMYCQVNCRPLSRNNIRIHSNFFQTHCQSSLKSYIAYQMSINSALDEEKTKSSMLVRNF